MRELDTIIRALDMKRSIGEPYLYDSTRNRPFQKSCVFITYKKFIVNPPFCYFISSICPSGNRFPSLFVGPFQPRDKLLDI